MARVTKFHDDGSISVMDYAEPSYSDKRGKVTPTAKASWDAKDGHGKSHDPQRGKQVLDEALGD